MRAWAWMLVVIGTIGCGGGRAAREAWPARGGGMAPLSSERSVDEVGRAMAGADAAIEAMVEDLANANMAGYRARRMVWGIDRGPTCDWI
jgi:hypothetical protein